MSLAARAVRHILTARTTPARLGWAVGVGVLIGCSPFIGMHLAICIVVAATFGLNQAVTYLAANISVPWMQPLLIFSSLQLGTWVLEGRWLALDMSSLRATGPLEFGEAWLVGSFLLGLAVGTPAGLLTFAGVNSYRKRHPLPRDPVSEALERTARAFRSVGRFAHGYTAGKLAHDPVYRQLVERSPLASPVLDLGCGRGHVAMLLHQLDAATTIRGFDWDERKVAQASRLGIGPNAVFDVVDIHDVEVPPSGTILLIDVLHYAEPERQDALIERAADALLPGGRLFIREVDAAAGWRARVTRWQERLALLFRLNRADRLYLRPAGELVAVLEGRGLTVTVSPSWGNTPLANVLLEARKPAG